MQTCAHSDGSTRVNLPKDASANNTGSDPASNLADRRRKSIRRACGVHSYVLQHALQRSEEILNFLVERKFRKVIVQGCVRDRFQRKWAEFCGFPSKFCGFPITYLQPCR